MSDLERPSGTHPICPICEVSMWLTRVELGDIADNQRFECKVCDRTARRISPREQHAP
jgi:transposase-like protein